jgi:hypothetical protein
MKLTKQQVLDLNKGLHNVSRLGGARFAYAVARNLSKLNSEVESIAAAFDAHENFIAYDKERAEVAATFAEKNPDGSPKLEGQRYIVTDEDALAKALEPVKEKHKAAIEEREKQIKDFEELLKEEVEIDIYMVNQIFLPETITADQISGIILMVDEKEIN